MLQSNTSLQHLNIASNECGDTGLGLFAEAFAVNDSLRSLDLTNNCIESGDGFEAFVERLGENVISLTSLSLASNMLGRNGGKLLGEALKRNTKLTELDVNTCHLGYGTKALIDGVGENSSLTRLKIGRNLVPKSVVKSLARVLKKNTTLKELVYSWNQMEGGKELGEALAENSSLTMLEIMNAKTSGITAQRLAKGIAMNQTLTQLDLE